ncbi:2-keto-3-deoxy-D-arabino-heptulosonate-7-phosphate synthase I alpha (EC [Olavius algarvensis associated proteobacterium Delta 3]|nr:2-keto-3-deoxy-D-arabino-heptulosonate-7-phosphate synthase I alpha (EC [Olavius algarvensis associated proteobacterium Delta 3]CAB5155520.1 2-keto-3-deoxy-D-arabino-heptulosonate-7-phosphate synthase I alpha (EC [Olavius algarvensis associated proteobacterium Delta 3]
MERTQDLRVGGYKPMMSPKQLMEELPMSAKANQTVVAGRDAIQKILGKEDARLLVVVGPCSIHDESAAFEYAGRLAELADKVKETQLVVMRVYFEKPRTTVGWKGLINDPLLDGSCDIRTGLRKARRLLLKTTEIGLPTATEFLESVTPQYIADLVCWAAIGARTTESQIHREMASGLSMPVGFKNGTDGNMATAINALIAARAPQSFLGIDHDGRTCIVQTVGNPFGHIVLRGGKRPNYDRISVEEARLDLITKDLPDSIVVDCSHANSRKKHQGQAIVWKHILEQRLSGTDSLIGMMLESNLSEGNQKFSSDPSQLTYGVSVTDECISWETTESLLLSTHERILETGFKAAV